eukprot:c12502_g1_i1 orf=411-1136(-)
MASTSDPPAAGGGEASSVAAAVVTASAAPPAEPPPPSSSSSKRRWSPCTWRYAIEEVQPELGSRPRSNNSNPFYSAPSLRAGSEHAAPPPSTNKSRPNHHQDHVYGKEGEEPIRRSAYGNRTWGGAEISELRARHAQPRTQETLSRKKRPPHPQLHHQHQQKESVKRRSPKDEEEEDEEDEDEDDDDGDDVELGHHFEEGTKRKKREMSPSELYYCEICRAKAEASKSNAAADSPPPSQDP